MSKESAVHQQAKEGASNLLTNCLEVCAGEKLLIVFEDPALGWYDEAPAELVAEVASELGVQVTLRRVGGPDNRYVGDNAATDAAQSIDKDFDCCIFFARIGDQLRFDPQTGRKRAMCYVTSMKALASSYGGIHYRALADLKVAIDALLFSAAEITMHCPQGTNLTGTARGSAPDDDVTIKRFPVGVHTPLSASGFAGEVYLARYLTPTGSRVYEPASAVIEHPLMAKIAGGVVVEYLGAADDVERVKQHYAHVSALFDLDPAQVLSWHAGLHPGCQFKGRAGDDPDKWSNTVFTNPRFAHFHTCGRTAPGEVCWMILDPTISVDGVALWEEGSLHPDRFPELRKCLELWPELLPLYQGDTGAVGLS